uniref:Uncharacterized protein LOC104214426 n=1 Tax=Nicotiana sylvestris TaxID=4096 RepID=A0A1U7VKK8_NICSY
MDVKSDFLNGFLKEEVYIKLSPGFERHVHPEHVFKLDKALYRLKKVLRACYAEADYAGYLVNKKSTSRMAHFLDHVLSHRVYTYGSFRTQTSKSDFALLRVFAQKFQKPSRNLVPVTQ